ncbi:MAG: hypothetical protein FK734_05015 [Asgard group archaeon]|nr:hypothetical protein [Asgard group archaeon]
MITIYGNGYWKGVNLIVNDSLAFLTQKDVALRAGDINNPANPVELVAIEDSSYSICYDVVM